MFDCAVVKSEILPFSDATDLNQITPNSKVSLDNFLKFLKEKQVTKIHGQNSFKTNLLCFSLCLKPSDFIN